MVDSKENDKFDLGVEGLNFSSVPARIITLLDFHPQVHQNLLHLKNCEKGYQYMKYKIDKN